MQRYHPRHTGTGGEANGADHGQGTVQHEHGGARREARPVPGHGDAVHGRPQGAYTWLVGISGSSCASVIQHTSKHALYSLRTTRKTQQCAVLRF